MKIADPEILEQGIKVFLGGEYWILFTKTWGSTDSQKFRNAANDMMALRMLIEKTVDWNIPDAKWEILPFEKDKLVAQIDAFVKDSTSDCFAIPTALQVALGKAYYTAIGESYKVDFLALCQSG